MAHACRLHFRGSSHLTLLRWLHRSQCLRSPSAKPPPVGKHGSRLCSVLSTPGHPQPGLAAFATNLFLFGTQLAYSPASTGTTVIAPTALLGRLEQTGRAARSAVYTYTQATPWRNWPGGSCTVAVSRPFNNRVLSALQRLLRMRSTRTISSPQYLHWHLQQRRQQQQEQQ